MRQLQYFPHTDLRLLRKILFLKGIADIDTNKLVRISEFLSPIYLPKKPDIIEAINGNAIIDISILSF